MLDFDYARVTSDWVGRPISKPAGRRQLGQMLNISYYYHHHIKLLQEIKAAGL